MTAMPHEQAQRHIHTAAEARPLPAERAAFAAHLAECDACRADAAERAALEVRINRVLHAHFDHPHAVPGAGRRTQACIQGDIMHRHALSLVSALAGTVVMLVLVAAVGMGVARSAGPTGAPATIAATSPAESGAAPGPASLPAQAPVVPPDGGRAPQATATPAPAATATVSESDTIGWPALGIERDNPEAGRALGPGFCTGPITGPAGSGVLAWPLLNDTASRAHIFLTQDFGPAHGGIDVAAPLGTPILAADGGVVLYAGWTDNGAGFAVIVDHGDGWQTFYAHLETVAARCGASIAQGAALGTVGSTGRSTGPHLHFGVYSSRDGLVNPLDRLPPMPAAEEP